MPLRLSLAMLPAGALAILASACATQPETPAADPGLAHGEALARQYCAACHGIGRSDPSRMSGAIPFRDLSQLYPVEGLEEALVEGLVTGHPDMPEFQFSAEAANDFIRYLASIQSN